MRSRENDIPIYCWRMGEVPGCATRRIEGGYYPSPNNMFLRMNPRYLTKTPQKSPSLANITGSKLGWYTVVIMRLVVPVLSSGVQSAKEFKFYSTAQTGRSRMLRFRRRWHLCWFLTNGFLPGIAKPFSQFCIICDSASLKRASNEGEGAARW